MGSRTPSQSPVVLPDFPCIPCITLGDDDDDKENIANGSEYDEEYDAQSYQWKSVLKPITAETNVINKKQMYKSNSSVLHAALDAVSKKRKSVKGILKPVKSMTEEEVRKELKELNSRRAELMEALKGFEKKEVKSERNQQLEFAALESESSATTSSRSSMEPFPSRSRTSSVKEKPHLATIGKKSLPSQRRLSSIPNIPAKNISPHRRMSMKSPRKSMGQDSHQRVLMDDNGHLIQHFDESNNVSETNATVVELEQKLLKQTITNVPALPYSKDYDPTKTVHSDRVSFVVQEMREGFKHLYYQPDLPDNKVKVPFMKEYRCNTFYLFGISGDNREKLKNQIEHLGGIVADSLHTATKLLFYPQDKKMVTKELFFFLTAAVGGRYLLPGAYISESADAGKFLNVNDYCTSQYYDHKFDLDTSTLCAINISNFYRNLYAQNKYPRFHRHNVLLAVPRREEKDVELLLQILGAYVQPLYDNKKFLKNPLYTLCVTDGRTELRNESELIPRTSPSVIRNILWTTFENFKEKIDG